MKRPLTTPAPVPFGSSNGDETVSCSTAAASASISRPGKRARLVSSGRRVSFTKMVEVQVGDTAGVNIVSDSSSVEEEEEEEECVIVPLHKRVPGAPPLFQTLTEEDCQRLWFQRDELMAAKERMRHMIRFGTIEEYGAEDMSGLKGRYSLERSQHKRSAIYYTIAAHQHSPGDHSFVRAVSKRCTGWARHVAAEEGFATYCEVYGDPLDDDSFMGTVNNNDNNNNDTSNTFSAEDFWAFESLMEEGELPNSCTTTTTTEMPSAELVSSFQREASSLVATVVVSPTLGIAAK